MAKDAEFAAKLRAKEDAQMADFTKAYKSVHSVEHGFAGCPEKCP